MFNLISAVTDRHLPQIRTLILSREQNVEQKRVELRKLEDGLIRLRKELEQRLKEVTTSSTSPQGDSEREGLLVCSNGLEKFPRR